jgi:hypothetical protein
MAEGMDSSSIRMESGVAAESLTTPSPGIAPPRVSHGAASWNHTAASQICLAAAWIRPTPPPEVTSAPDRCKIIASALLGSRATVFSHLAC